MELYTPYLTYRFDLALQFASGLHHNQARKGAHIPYIAHLMSVAALVLEAAGNEDQAIAVLLPKRRRITSRVGSPPWSSTASCT